VLALALAGGAVTVPVLSVSGDQPSSVASAKPVNEGPAPYYGPTKRFIPKTCGKTCR
jgi:hypothetical protein